MTKKWTRDEGESRKSGMRMRKGGLTSKFPCGREDEDIRTDAENFRRPSSPRILVTLTESCLTWDSTLRKANSSTASTTSSSNASSRVPHTHLLKPAVSATSSRANQSSSSTTPIGPRVAVALASYGEHPWTLVSQVPPAPVDHEEFRSPGVFTNASNCWIHFQSLKTLSVRSRVEAALSQPIHLQLNIGSTPWTSTGLSSFPSHQPYIFRRRCISSGHRESMPMGWKRGN